MTDIETLLGTALADRYRIIRLIGTGGMAAVYLAEDIKHRREVALKVLRSDLAESVGSARFQREIETAARLQHPHILTVFDSGDTGGILWFTMPYVEGESLRTRLDREKQLPVDEAIRIARQAAQALQYAHEHDVVHRDIKPDNILLTRDGSTLVADFGIARAIGESGDASTLTQTGTSIGTPAYMSPEQASGERAIDARSDIYALGAVLYEMLAGEAPYTGPTAQVIIAKRFTTPVPSIRVTRATVPPQLDQAISRALALVPGDRFASATEFASALTRSTAAAASTENVSRRSWWLGGAIAAVLLLVAAVAFGRWRSGTSPASATAADAGPPRIAVLPFENRGDSADAYFADGMTDAVRGKLSMLPGVEVIARASTLPYAGSAIPPSQIAAELGVRYLLTAVVRWERNAAGDNIVHVTPELTEVRADGPPTTKWQRSFDQPLTNVFQVQADIAGEVASQMRIALAATTRENLDAVPTLNPDAYDAFLRAEAFNGHPGVESLRQAVHFAERAVALDSAFAEAWALLAITRANLYGASRTERTPELADASLAAARRGIALNPSIPLVHRALGAYYRLVANDVDRALEAYEAGLERDPNDASSLTSASAIYFDRGNYEQAVAALETAARLDPRRAAISLRLSAAYEMLGDYAQAEDAASRAITLAPGDPNAVNNLVSLALDRGRLEDAHRIIRDAAREMDATALYTNLATFGDFAWVLDSAAQTIAMTAPLKYYDDLKAGRDIVGAQIWYLRGDARRAAIWADSALTDMRDYLREHPDDSEMLAIRGLAEALAGRTEAAETTVEAARRIATGGLVGYIDHVAARIYLLAGDHDRALTLLEGLVERRAEFFTPERLRIDANFAPLRGDPRFERIVNRTP